MENKQITKLPVDKAFLEEGIKLGTIYSENKKYYSDHPTFGKIELVLEAKRKEDE